MKTFLRGVFFSFERLCTFRAVLRKEICPSNLNGELTFWHICYTKNKNKKKNNFRQNKYLYFSVYFLHRYPVLVKPFWPVEFGGQGFPKQAFWKVKNTNATIGGKEKMNKPSLKPAKTYMAIEISLLQSCCWACFLFHCYFLPNIYWIRCSR